MTDGSQVTFAELLACRDAVAEAAAKWLPPDLALELANNIAASLADGIEKDVEVIRTAVNNRVRHGWVGVPEAAAPTLIFELVATWRRAMPRR
jgi:hypothetical protein